MADQKNQPFTGTPAFFPGQKGALADQLSWGFGQRPAAWDKMLGNTFTRMQPFPDYPYTTPPAPDKPDKPGKKPDKPGDPGTNTGDDGWTGNEHSSVMPMMSGLSALGGYPMQGTPQQYPGNATPQYSPMPQQMMGQQQPQMPQQGGLMALNPQALALWRQMYGGR